MQRVISQTPVRISLFGGGTDYPTYYKRKPGATLGFTIDKHIYVSLNPISDFFDYKLRISYSKIELVQSVEEIEHPSVRACLLHKQLDVPIDIHIAADLPAKTGLGSSSAFTVGFLNALYAVQGLRISKQKLAEEACHIEQSVIGENVGSQDQFHAAYGGMNIFEFSQSKIKVKPLIISAEKKTALENSMLIFYTGLTRYANEVVEEQMRKTNDLSNDEYLEKMYETVFEAEELIDAASAEELPKLLGERLHQSWLLKKQLSSKISNSKIDHFYELARDFGAYGGKLCGAGGGGFLVFIVPPAAKPRIRIQLKDLLEVRFRFESQGSRVIYMKE